MQKEVAFYYFGSKFITWTVKLPVYNIRPSYRFNSIKQKFSSEINTFLKEDILAFATSFDVTANLDDVKFESVHGTPGVNANFVLVPPLKGMSASKTTKSILQDCGIDVGNTTPIAINPCTATYHKQHDFLMPFYKTNDQLLRHYKRVMNGRDAERKRAIQEDHDFLTQLKDHPSNYHNTKFHCMGQPLAEDEDYNEDEWVERLYHSIKGCLPGEIEVVPSFQYSRNFTKFQNLITGIKNDQWFLFRAVPDIMFKRTDTTVPSALHISNEFLEVKKAKASVNSNTETEFSQVMSSMYSVAVAMALRQLAKGNTVKNIKSKGLLVCMMKSMHLFTLKASIGNVDVAGMYITRHKIMCEDNDIDQLPLDFVCSGISYLLQDDTTP